MPGGSCGIEAAAASSTASLAERKATTIRSAMRTVEKRCEMRSAVAASLQYTRGDYELRRGMYRVRGEVIDVEREVELVGGDDLGAHAGLLQAREHARHRVGLHRVVDLAGARSTRRQRQEVGSAGKLRLCQRHDSVVGPRQAP